MFIVFQITRKVFLGVVKAGELDSVEVFLSNGVHPDFLLEVISYGTVHMKFANYNVFTYVLA